MTGSDVFSTTRFGLLIKKEIREGWRSWLVSLGALLGLMDLLSILCANNCYYEGISANYYSYESARYELLFFAMILFIAGAFVASGAFKTMATPPSALSVLMLPASQLEKFLLRWVVTVPVFFIATCIFAVMADLVRVGYAHMQFGMGLRCVPWFDLLLHPENHDYAEGFVRHLLLLYFCVQSFFFLGSVFWVKRAMVKTFVSLGLIAWAYFLVGTWMFSAFQPEGSYYNGFSWINEDTAPVLFDAFSVAVALFNYALAYARFKESELINRW